MLRSALVLAVALLLVPLSAFAEEPPAEEAPAEEAPAEEAPAEEAPAPRKSLFVPAGGASAPFVELHGKYALWSLNQHGFMLGSDHPLDDADYVVQMLRLSLKAGFPSFGVVARLDAAQGWWGADNNPDVQTGVATDANGNVSALASYNTYKLFGNKDTNYTVHFDHAYAYIEVPTPFVWRFQIGRQYYGAGHKLVLDEDYDGITMTMAPHEAVKFSLLWGLVSEGVGSYKAPVAGLMSDGGNFGDANLVGGTVAVVAGPVSIGAFGFYYWDVSDDENSTFLPQGYGYLVARHQPNKSRVGAFGLTLDGTLPVAAGLTLALEFDGLVGRDNVDNTDHAGGTLDINNGTLNGFNGYLRADQAFAAGPVGLRAGVLFGIGSGDNDKTGGRGNINKIQTMGFFPLTNVWEDSVMPDISGISPQGLGSPVSRGYREFENTLAVQGRFGITPWGPIKLDLSYTFLRAVAPIAGFDATGTPTDDESSDIGHEIDADLVVTIWPGVTYKALFGVFLPGDGAGYLMLGHADNLTPAWELKQVVTVAF